MSRDIKFRAWDKKMKKMFIPAGLYLPNGGNLQDFGEGKYIHMQYVGLKDKNGKEIYEGDIVRRFPTDPAPGQVGFINGGYWINDGSNYPDRLGDVDASKTFELQIIGNIYENPELLAPTPVVKELK